MKKIWGLFFTFCCFAFAKAQKLDDFSFESNFRTFEGNQINTINNFFYNQEKKQYLFGLPEVNFYQFSQFQKIDIGLYAEEKRMADAQNSYQYSLAEDNKNPKKVDFSVNIQDNFNRRTHDDLNFYGRRTRDGGIKNEVFQSQERPIYFGLYPRNGYYYYR
ncbi:hypothetical protein [Mesonia sp. K7]|uniref:hypothetical protein n=1 Tax=Mesonia sp. K7 TaxID=2218606 RepID=UPI000DA86C69|nr:hypothetical protein [Mesonia sp. K7]PZD78260.1 hypothetical protein DNG35_06055 [Mesonia sp. K7]